MAAAALRSTARRAAAAAAPAFAPALGASAPSRAMSYTNTAGQIVRSATTGLRCTIFGAYGFVGRHVTGLIAGAGTQTVVPYRGDDMEWRHLKVMGDLGVVAPMPFSPHDDDSIRRALEGSDVVINLCGKDYETRHYVTLPGFPSMVNWSFRGVHVDLAAKLARLSVEAGATNFIHVSALGADKYSISEWARTKAAGEEAVRAEAPGAVIVRPADVFGPEDRFLNLFARLQDTLPRIPLIDGGAARVQPLFVDDLAQAIFKIAHSEDPEVMLGQTYDLAGPDEYTYREVVEFVLETVRSTRPEVVNISPAVADALGTAIGLLPNPLVNKDRLRRMQADVVLDPTAATKRLHDLGIEATSMESPGFTFLHRFRTGSHFRDMVAEAGGQQKYQ